MIYVEMNGRLGNQMFRYAFARWLQLKGQPEDPELIFDFSSVLQEKKGQSMPGWEDSLRHFNTVPYRYYQKKGKILINETTLSEKALLGIIKAADKAAGDRTAKRLAARKPFLHYLNNRGIYQMFTGYDYPYIWVPGRKLVSGPFECARYSEEIRDTLLTEFVPRYPVREKNRDLLEAIRTSNSVCITIRRGNYLQYPALNVCTKTYFEKAAVRMDESVKDAVFFVFSDDIEWARTNLRLPGKVFYESGDDPVWEKMRLMYSCRHFVISNSTFSWWAQFLGNNKDKKVIAPGYWFNADYQPPLFENGWICLDPVSGESQ